MEAQAYGTAQATPTEWPLVDPQYVLDEIRASTTFYTTYKHWALLKEFQKSKVKQKWKELSEELKQRIASNALSKYENAQNAERERQAVNHVVCVCCLISI